MASITFKGIAKSYGTTDVIQGIDLKVRDGEFLVFVGPSGCGKSTMLRMIAGLESITSGDLWIDDQRVNEMGPSERGAAMVFQSYALYPHMTVEENMGFGLKMSGLSKAETKLQVGRAAETLQITHLLHRYPKQLSGGQRQRVAIGRAIVRTPKVFLFDEPLSNLDAALRVQLRIELAKLHEQVKTTMIYVTHDQTEAMTLGDRIAVFNKGKIEQLGTPQDLYKAPANQFVAEFLGTPKINMIPYQWVESQQGIQLANQLLLKPAQFPGRALPWSRGCALGVRPEHLHIGDPESGMTAQVELVEYLGDASIVYARLMNGGELLTVKHSHARQDLQPGQTIGLHASADDIFLFDQDGLRVNV
jgi:multiple sugar transport system ATP-binding protein